MKMDILTSVKSITSRMQILENMMWKYRIMMAIMMPTASMWLLRKRGDHRMVTYFDEKHCREYGCIYYDPDVILCCKRNFKDPVDGMDACCEPPAFQDDGFHALLDKTFS